ncbi:MAG TPA: sigma-54 dependent transcriptional regulator [Edaphocola sp.]|nr:sigma-54 dependent transcriptional regulator [Edaphocola sp.]
MKRLLLLSSDLLLCKLFESHTKQFSLQTTVSPDFEDVLPLLKKGHYATVVVNVPLLAERCPKKIIRRIKAANAYIPIFIMIDKIDVSEAIALTKLGAEYCYSKPYALEQIIEHISILIKEPVLGGRNNLKKPQERPKYLQAKSKPSEYLHQQIDLVADTNFKVIIYGETGTGKEAVARKLCSGRYKDKPFVAIDCGCLSRELAASELFGHVKGSFSGAYSDKKGAFEEADGGTIFLDEIGNLDYAVQNLLLRAIEEKKIKRIGSNEEKDIDVRIIVASNEKLYNAVQKGNFREDLYYRLNEFEITIPPLRERMEDLELFVDFFKKEVNEDLGKNIRGVQPDLLKRLKAYDWPGNIRELKNIVRRGCLMATSMITSNCLSPEFLNKIDNQLKSRELDDLPSIKEECSLKTKSIISDYEEILDALKEEDYNKTKAAERLNITRKTLYNKLKAFRHLLNAKQL